MEKVEINKVVVMAIYMKNIMIRQFLGIVAATVDTACILVDNFALLNMKIAGLHLVARHSAVGKIVLTVEM
jgi:hypothetical protein